MTETLAEVIAERLLEAIIDGHYATRSSLPPEGDLAITHEVSRLTIREAIRILRTHNVVRIQRGRGTQVNPPEQWTSLKAIVRASAGGKTASASERLLEARRIIEVGAVQLAAQRRSEQDLDSLERLLGAMRTASAAADVSAFVDADIQFHNVIMTASGNLFIPLLLDTFGSLLIETRRQTSGAPEIQQNAIQSHAAIVAAMHSGDPEAARLAMAAHMDQTQRDLQEQLMHVDDTVPEESLVGDLPADRALPATVISDAMSDARRLVVLDDDPTGTQTIRDLPVLTRWDVEDIRWALQQPTSAFFILTNTRSLSADEAARRNREVARACFEAAAAEGVDIAFASRSDSTLRGHFPLETDELVAASADYGKPIDAVIIVPAYIDAGRITIDSVHWLRTATGMLRVGSSEFARDATFGYASSHLPLWVEEKTKGKVTRADVERIRLTDLRVGGPDLVAARLKQLRGGRMVVVDAVTDDDLRILALAVLNAEASDHRFVYRVGPSFVRARAGQDNPAPVTAEQLRDLVSADRNGLVVVGSHVALTTRQLDRLIDRMPLIEVEIDVPELLTYDDPGPYLASLAEAAIAGLATSHVALRTTRQVITGTSGEDSLAIARRVSDAVVRVVRDVVAAGRPGFLVAKGGITASDVATDGLEIVRAWVRGTLLPGVVSLWEPASGIALGLPYIVFAGNVGDDEALADVIGRLSKS